MSVSLKILAGRVAGIAMAAVLGALEKSGVPHDERGCLAVAGVALVAVVAASPDLFAAAGIIRPLSPVQMSLYQKAVAGVQALIATPAANRRQKAEALAAQGLQDALENPTTREYLREKLWQPGQPVPAGAQPIPGDSPTIAAADPAITQTADPAITQTGGNQ